MEAPPPSIIIIWTAGAQLLKVCLQTVKGVYNNSYISLLRSFTAATEELTNVMLQSRILIME